MARMIFVNLPVRDLPAATRFYIAIGGVLNPQFSNDDASSVMFSDSIGVMPGNLRYGPLARAKRPGSSAG